MRGFQRENIGQKQSNKYQIDIWQSPMYGILKKIEQNKACKVLRKSYNPSMYEGKDRLFQKYKDLEHLLAGTLT